MNASRVVACSSLGLIALFVASTSASAIAGTPREELLALVPPDAGVTIVVDSLRDRSREILASPLVQRLRSLPAVKAWKQSEKAKDWKKSQAEIQSALGLSLASLRDDIVGDALVLALHLPADRHPDAASGLLLTRFRDRKALDRLIDTVNASEIANGTLKQVVEIPAHDGVPRTWHREFVRGTKPDEWYAILGENTFAWSNSESLLREALSRTKAGDGLVANPRFRVVDRALPDAALARIYLDPRFLQRLIESEARGGKSAVDPQVIYALSALEYAGAGLLWQDGPILHLHQSFDPKRVPSGIFGKASGGDARNSALRRIPGSAVAVGAWRWDVARIYDLLFSHLAEADRVKAENALTMVKGMLMGKDLRREILPYVGRSSSFYVDVPDHGPVSAVWSIDLLDRADVAQAIENGLRTFAALVALDPNRKGGPLRVESTDQGGVRVTTLAGGETPLSFAAAPNRLVIGSDPDTVRRALAPDNPAAHSADESAVGRMSRAFFPGSENFLALDLAALHRAASSRRDLLACRHATSRGVTEAEARRDLDRALELIEPFGGAFFSWTFSAPEQSLHQVIGVVGRDKVNRP